MTSGSKILDGSPVSEESLDALVRRAQGGEESAFEEILDRFESSALLTARGMGASRQDAEDIAQEAFLKVFRYIRSYRSESSFKAYFHRIVINACRDHLSRKGPAAVELSEETAGAVTSGADVADEVEMVRRALQSLPPREREVAILRDMQGLSTWQVARILMISPITVRRHSSRALARLRELLDPSKR